MHYIGAILVFLFGPFLWGYLLWALVFHEAVLVGGTNPNPDPRRTYWRRISRNKNPGFFWFYVFCDFFVVVVTSWLTIWLFMGWVH